MRPLHVDRECSHTLNRIHKKQTTVAGADCADLLKDFFDQLREFYVSVIDRLGENEQQDVTEGMAAILAKQPLESLYDNMKLCCDPIVQRIVQKARAASDEKSKLEIAGMNHGIDDI